MLSSRTKLSLQTEQILYKTLSMRGIIWATQNARYAAQTACARQQVGSIAFLVEAGTGL